MMRRTGNPEAPYDIAGRADEQVRRFFQPEGGRLKLLLNVCFLVGLGLWFLDWVTNLVGKGNIFPLVSTLQVILLLSAAYGFINRKEKMAIAYTSFFWMTVFVRSANSVGINTVQRVLLSLLVLAFMLYSLHRAFVPTTRRRQSLHHKLEPVFKLLALVLLLVTTLFGIVLFFIGIKQNYLSLSNLFYIPGSALLLLILSGEFRSERWMRMIGRLGPMVFLLALLGFGLLDGILDLIILNNRSQSSSIVLFFLPLLRNLFAISMILPAYITLNFNYRYPVRQPSASTVLATQPNAEEEIGTEESMDAPQTMPYEQAVNPQTWGYEEPQMNQMDPMSYTPFQEPKQEHQAWQPVTPEHELQYAQEVQGVRAPEPEVSRVSEEVAGGLTPQRIDQNQTPWEAEPDRREGESAQFNG